jgi:hypothetical protein
MDTQLIIRIDKDTKKKLYETTRMEGKTASEKVRELVRDYVVKNDFTSRVDKLWNKVSADFEKSGYTEADIDRVIKEVRAEKAKRQNK